jgi:methyl-accepting chemotaxis protein
LLNADSETLYKSTSETSRSLEHISLVINELAEGTNNQSDNTPSGMSDLNNLEV